jgi:hypothetical protein
MDPSIHFAQIQQLGVAVPINDIGEIEIYLDDSVVVAFVPTTYYESTLQYF